MSDYLTTYDLKILKYLNKFPCAAKDLPPGLGKNRAERFYILKDLGYIVPNGISREKTANGVFKPSKVYTLSAKAKIYMENRYCFFIEDVKNFILRETITVITASATAAFTTKAMSAVVIAFILAASLAFHILKSTLSQ